MTELSPDNLRPSPLWDSFRSRGQQWVSDGSMGARKCPRPSRPGQPSSELPRAQAGLGKLGWAKAPRQVSGAETGSQPSFLPRPPGTGHLSQPTCPAAFVLGLPAPDAFQPAHLPSRSNLHPSYLPLPGDFPQTPFSAQSGAWAGEA